MPIKKAKCKICRRIGEKLFLKGDKCFSPKCPLLRKPYPPGDPQGKTQKKLSEYGRQLRETQKLKKMYGLSDRHFKKIVREVLKKRGKEDVSDLLLRRIEKKIFNVIYRVGLAPSRDAARQLISHGHFCLNGKRVTVPSIEVKVGDEISLREGSKKLTYFKNTLPLVKTENIPSWLSFDKEKCVIKVIDEPKVDDLRAKIDVPLILARYSR